MSKILTHPLLIIGLCCFSILATANDVKGYQIDIKVNGFEEETVYLGYHYGTKQYIKDTFAMIDKGRFVLEGEEPLPGGIYMLIMPPENSYFEFFISDENTQQFSLETNAEDPVANMKVKGSKENELFYTYLNYIKTQKADQQALVDKEKIETDKKKLEKLHQQIDQIDADMRAYQEKLIAENPNTLMAEVIQMTFPIDVPSPDRQMTEEEESQWRFNYYRSRFLENINFENERTLRTPLFENKIETYLERLTVKHPDSINIAADYILEKSSANDEVFKYSLIYILNKYAKSKIVGMDAVYVHIVDNYYAKGKAPWVAEEELKKIKKHARELRPLLIGKKAPNIKLKKFDGTPRYLYDIEAEYMVVYFWDPKCGHCNKAAPDVVKFAQEYKAKGVEMYAICTKDKEPENCAEAVIEKGFQDFFNVMALTNEDQYYRLYYAIKTTPVVYILDKDKTILSKNIAASQLGEVMDMIIKRKAELGY